MSVWLEKYKPKFFRELAIPDHHIDALISLSIRSNPPHLLLSGPPGCGKTMAHQLVCRQVLGPSWTSTTHVLQARDLARSKGAMKRFEDFLRPEGSDSDDTLAGRTSLDAFGAELTSFNTQSPNPVGELESPPEDGKRMVISRIIVIEDADYLGHARQSYLRRMLEESSSSARFIFTTHTPSRMIEALRSRTQHIRIPHPSRITIEQHLDRIFASEGLSPKPGLTGDIAHVCQGNLRKAIFMSQLLAERNLIHDRKNVQQLMANTPLRDVQFMIEEALRGRVHEWKWEEQGQKNVRVLKGAMGKFDSLSQQQSMDERDVLNRCYAFLTEGRLQFQNEMLCELLDALSRCDVRLQHSLQGRIQIESFLHDVAEIGSTYLH